MARESLEQLSCVLPGLQQEPGRSDLLLVGRAGGGGKELELNSSFSLSFLFLPLTTFFHLFFSPFPSIPLSCMIFRAPLLSAPFLLPLQRERWGGRGEEVCLSPYFGALVSRGQCSLQVQILPWGGG